MWKRVKTFAMICCKYLLGILQIYCNVMIIHSVHVKVVFVFRYYGSNKINI